MADVPANASAPVPAHVGGLGSRTFIGLLVSQFFAAFNDQAIHAAAMFFAINKALMTEKTAISIMPILFYCPWAIFCTLAGYFADRYPKRNSLIAWKIAEVAITGIAILGFWIGNSKEAGGDKWGPIIVLGCVFLMGVHSAFFVPAKYGVMPEILPQNLLSKGNGLLESLSFLAVILGTVCGGVLSYAFYGREVYIGWVLFALAVVGAIASFLMKPMPAANPDRRLPRNIYAPIVQSLKTLFSTKPLRVALLGIAFFTFVVAFMRAAVYMLGESQNPRWDELKTSVVVGTVALGIGLGSPLAGLLSGKRVELRLVLLGAIGMIVLLVTAGLNIRTTGILVACIIGVGFFTGFYIVPLFTLLQHKAPKTSKGEMIATSNFINVVGAISASLLFYIVVTLAQASGVAPVVTAEQRKDLGTGTLTALELRHGRPASFLLTYDDGKTLKPDVELPPVKALDFSEILEDVFGKSKTEVVLEVSTKVNEGDRVSVSQFDQKGVPHYEIVGAGDKPTPDYDNANLPTYLMIGAAIMTLLIAVALGKPLLDVHKSENAGK